MYKVLREVLEAFGVLSAVGEEPHRVIHLETRGWEEIREL